MTNLRPVLAFAVLSAAVIACADGNSPATSPIEGLATVSTSDTGTKKPVDPPVGVGSFHGVVRGYTTGIMDTLGTAVLLDNVTVTAYHRSGSGDIGAFAASVLTNASGVFQMPTLPMGEYAVVFTPPSGSLYAGGWTVTTVGPTSNASPWWIMLPKK
jgi:hypothetical protein